MPVAESDMTPNTAPRPSVLLVDGHGDTRDLYAEYLLLQGIAVSTAADTREALVNARRDTPEVIVTELVIAQGGGVRLLRELRRDPRTSGAMLIVLTATSDDAVRERARASCDAILTKPCAPEDLLGSIRAHLAARAPHGGAR